MKYTVRFAHMKNAPAWKEGDTIRRGDVIGIMGSTGQSDGAHLHIDCVRGVVSRPFKLHEIGPRFTSDKRQLDFFIDNELFGVAPVITTQYMDEEYRMTYGKDHPAYDVVPNDRHDNDPHLQIHWNRSRHGTVALVVYQMESYGHCIYITFDA